MKEWNGKSLVGYLKKVVIEQAREIEVLEGKLKTAKADGIRELTDEYYLELNYHYACAYLNKLEADNGED